MNRRVDLGPAAADLKGVLAALEPDMLQRDTPCAEFTVADLLNHCLGAVQTLADAAEHAVSTTRPDAGEEDGGDENDEDVTARELCAEVDRLAAAWSDPALAGVDSTTAGGMTMPVAFHHMIAVQELVLHAWDLSKATGLDHTPDPEALEALHEFLTEVADHAPRDRSGPFGPAVQVDDNATTLDRVLGLSGRDPHWPPGS